MEGEEVYNVEGILKHWRRGRGYQFYVLWEGYPITEASWEPELVFSADGDTLADYKLQHQLLWNQHTVKMSDLDFILLNILEQFDDFYCNVALIVWATKTDTLSSLVDPNFLFFDPLQMIGKYE